MDSPAISRSSQTNRIPPRPHCVITMTTAWTRRFDQAKPAAATSLRPPRAPSDRRHHRDQPSSQSFHGRVLDIDTRVALRCAALRCTSRTPVPTATRCSRRPRSLTAWPSSPATWPSPGCGPRVGPEAPRPRGSRRIPTPIATRVRYSAGARIRRPTSRWTRRRGSRRAERRSVAPRVAPLAAERLAQIAWPRSPPPRGWWCGPRARRRRRRWIFNDGASRTRRVGRPARPGRLGDQPRPGPKTPPGRWPRTHRARPTLLSAGPATE